MMKNSLHLSTSVLLLCVLSSPSYGSEAKDDPIYSACPGLATWEHHRTTPHAEERGDMAPKAPSLPAVHDQLVRMAARDQAARESASKDLGNLQSQAVIELAKVDGENLQELKAIISKHGVPSSAQVGRDGVMSLWLIVQHASDIKLQQAVLEALGHDDSGVGKSELAMMSDRINVAQGLPQLYGTQFRKVDGKFVPYEIADPANVDSRRAGMDLMPLSDYLCVLQATYQ